MATSAKHELVVEVDLDVPGETARQARVFVLWFLCLGIAVAAAAFRRPQMSPAERDSEATTTLMESYRRDVLGIAALGLLLPGILTWWTRVRRRRGGPHARGIAVAVTEDGELRLWGRGYGQRVSLAGAQVNERLVDVYSGRMGQWRQRRLSVRAGRPLPGLPAELQVATPAVAEDETLGFTLVGGEGDCVELNRDNYLQVQRLVRKHVEPAVEGAP